MPRDGGNTVRFKLEKEGEDRVRATLQAVYAALEQKGYNPINQLTGYMISGDPAYITSFNEARNLICRVDRDEILEILLKHYLNKEEQ
ncbi:MAG TPA: IreB family regulatory phosphoprotein [Syntrophomonadaceae bacterium]|nr:IreB family regulatory phosphoprotein [Syntrophomonadaceae bacterium]